jgi:hypothetical protein
MTGVHISLFLAAQFLRTPAPHEAQHDLMQALRTRFKDENLSDELNKFWMLFSVMPKASQ